MSVLYCFAVSDGRLLSLRIVSLTWWPSRPPLALTSLAHSWKPCFVARPSVAKAPVSGSEIQIVIALPPPEMLAELVALVVPPHAATASADAAVKAVSAKSLARGRLILFLLFLDRSARSGLIRPLRALHRSAAPVRLRVDDRDRTGGCGRQPLHELAAALPLEDEHIGGQVLARAVELRGSLHGLQRDAAVQVRDDLRVVQALGGGDRGGRRLADRVRLGHVGVDIGWGAAVLRDVGRDHGLAQRVLHSAVPSVGHHEPGGVLGSHGAEERGALVRAGRRGEDL